LLNDVSFTLDRGERVCLLGRNGEGKSTLLRVLAGLEKVDSGTLAFSSGIRVATLPQVFPASLPGTVWEVIEGAHPESEQDHDFHLRLEKVLSQMDMDADALFDSLSGGQKRRVLLASALAGGPDILLLDEPTNHLDIEGIRWLENFLPRFQGAVLFVTHDRSFLRSVANRILELDRGRLSDWSCSYDKYLVRREVDLAAEEKQSALFDKRLAAEERWVRQGIKARRTRNEGRVRALKKMREERRQRRERSGTANLQLQEAGKSGQKVLETCDLNFDWGGEPMVRDFSTRISRGDKIGILGPNGCGKTTLIKLLLGQLEPKSGRVEAGTNLEITFFDQHRMNLDEEKSLQDNVGEGSEFVMFNGQRRHVISYLEDFLFPPARSRTPVKVLSGGERNRLLLAKMFTKPGNVLVMDEPTNDLDIETLELLEALLVEYGGTLLLVSHDREFVNNVVTDTIAWEGEGDWKEYPGGYDDWQDQKKIEAKVKNVKTDPAGGNRSAPSKRKALTGNEKQEWRELPVRIEDLEAELVKIGERLSSPEFYQLSNAEQKPLLKRSHDMPKELERLFARWEELEERAGS
jgi:ATP-binding cassette subfamily F protein uup